MIQELVDRFMANKAMLEDLFRIETPCSYAELVRHVIRVLENENGDCSPDPDEITCIGGGSYSGDLAFVIKDTFSGFYYVTIRYGSCSACDSFKAVRTMYEYDEATGGDIVGDKAINGFMTLALHVVQRMKKME